MREIGIENKILGFDLDGVIIDFSNLRLKILKEFGFESKLEQTSSDLIRELFPKEVVSKVSQLIYSDSKIALLPEVMTGAREALEKIKKSGTPYFLISRRKNIEIAKRLLMEKGLWPRFFDEQNTLFVLSPEDKNQKAGELGITHYLDDEIGVLEMLSGVPHRLLFDQFEIRSEITKYPRIFSWQELLEHIDL